MTLTPDQKSDLETKVHALVHSHQQQAFKQGAAIDWQAIEAAVIQFIEDWLAGLITPTPTPAPPTGGSKPLPKHP
jgi:hypothetical protein